MSVTVNSAAPSGYSSRRFLRGWAVCVTRNDGKSFSTRSPSPNADVTAIWVAIPGGESNSGFLSCWHLNTNIWSFIGYGQCSVN